jgi:hypothetical protein
MAIFKTAQVGPRAFYINLDNVTYIEDIPSSRRAVIRFLGSDSITIDGIAPELLNQDAIECN